MVRRYRVVVNWIFMERKRIVGAAFGFRLYYSGPLLQGGGAV